MLGCMLSFEFGHRSIFKTISSKQSNFCLLPFAFCLLIFLSSCSRAALLDQAQTAWDQGDFATAADKYEQFLKENPQSERASYARYRAATISHRDLKQYYRAIDHYIHFIEDFPRSPDIYQVRMRLAESYAAINKRREAISEYENLLPFLTDEREKRRVRLNIAELYYELNDLGQSVAEYQKVLLNASYDELSERAYLRIGGIRLLRDEFEDAIPAYQMVSQNTKDAAIRRAARLGMADCYERTSQYELAVKTLEETEPDPKSPDYLKQRITKIREHQRQRNLSIPSAPRLRRKR